uniref:Integrase catalytic domain-containing protein n=1 Tax=Cuerna arida TaxID=1464854 RepID=A0A1B6F786_9HEMI
MNSVITQLLNALGIEQRPGAAYMSQVQGAVEKYNHTLIKAISHYIVEKPQNWSKYVQIVTFAYNTSVNISTGYTPHYLMFGYEANLPADCIYLQANPEKMVLENIQILEQIRKDMPNIMKKAQEAQKKYFDRDKTHLDLNPGDEVLVHFPKDHTKKYSKFQTPFRGPFVVKKKINEVTYAVEIYHRGKLTEQPIHVARMKLFYKRI